MSTTTISEPALAVIENYLHLPFPDHDIACPYFVNRRMQVRGALRAMIGKGSPIEITEEATIVALKEKVNLKNLGNETLKKFLVDHHIGVDCSALVYYVLEAESRARNKGSLAKHIKFTYAKSWLRKFITTFRPVENFDVATLAHDSNSHEVNLSEIQPGDLVVMQNTGLNKDRDHVLLVHRVEANNQPLPYEGRAREGSIHYTHALQWSTDGKYNHGVRQGSIEITDISKPLIDQRWIEQAKTGFDNETWKRAHDAEKLLIKRLSAFTQG